jgi:hypothetical protein
MSVYRPTQLFVFLTIVYCAPSYMFRPIRMAIFRLMDWPKHVPWSTINNMGTVPKSYPLSFKNFYFGIVFT